MKVRALSGAADKIGYLFGFVYKEWQQKEQYIAQVGTSSGAITLFCLMCGDMEKGKELILKFTPKEHIFGFNPFGLKGIAKAVKSIIKADSGLWEFGKLEKTIRSITSKNKFDNYKGEPIYVGITDNKGKISYHNLKDYPYDIAIQKVIQSASIQLFIKSDNGYGDGGLIDHIGNEFLANKYTDCDVVSVFAREEKFEEKTPKKFISKLGWVLDVMMFNISVNNETETDKICKINGNNHFKYFMSSNPLKGMFKIKPEDNEKLFKMGYFLK